MDIVRRLSELVIKLQHLPLGLFYSRWWMLADLTILVGLSRFRSQRWWVICCSVFRAPTITTQLRDDLFTLVTSTMTPGFWPVAKLALVIITVFNTWTIYSYLSIILAEGWTRRTSCDTRRDGLKALSVLAIGVAMAWPLLEKAIVILNGEGDGQ